MANSLIQRLVRMYGFPRDLEEPKQWSDEMDRLLRGYSAQELDKAGEIILEGHRRNGFPSVGVILDGCAAARAALKPRKIETSKSKYPEWEPDAMNAADRLICGTMGRKAADEGWIFALHSFCREHNRLPQSQSEISDCKRTARAFDEGLEDCRAGRKGVWGQALIKLGESMLERREVLARIAYGEAS